MRNDALAAELEQIIGDYLKEQGLDLVELIFRYESMGLMLRILADRPQGGITIEECAKLNIRISDILDEKDIIQDRYTLEVSSPGLDRPLRLKKDFLRCLGREVRFFLSEPIAEKIEIAGRIKEVKDESVEVETETGGVEIPFFKITKAKQIIK
ncbi:MAG: ribosome maturation factor RimP [Candidatus Omnitrophica bacterium]|nr:ribosome maturation factor RimP [Candidatus Omnitrophota bacterium]